MSEIAEINAAAKAVLEIVRAFSQAQRERTAKIRRKLTAKIIVLNPRMKGLSS
ncbi:hypothetical protein GGQ68_002145 [Sagittula marina]|uniref:Uncharacterized protein n=1 Tax=Sagittula marina TaxID=943940 RepID=A0A7W6DS00_9RHOB|nr:hypothetical protein [Sagittula marina]MBB3985812.1 hypothetical protein [Sagittula marina]